MTIQYVPDVDLPDNDNDDLFFYFAEEQLYGYEMATYGTKAREGLNNNIEKAIYDALKKQIEKVAAEGGSTEFVLSGVSALKTTWTNTELGVASIEDTVVAEAAFTNQFNFKNIVTALLSDCPFDLYWYDKTETGGASMSYGVSLSGYQNDTQTIYNSATITNLTFTFKVASGYQDGDNTTVTSDVTKVNTAQTNAKAVVNANASKSDYEKLLGYKNEICNLTAYNDEAAKNTYTGGYGDPWQLIYVFDDDPDTNVVCEGYAKAFQYLCDLGGLDCICVSGTMSGGTGAGPHMWNVVTLDGENYLVDVTNCDEGTVGAPDKLFLVGGTYENDSYSYTINGNTISYTCDDLSLAASDYTVGEEEPTTYTVTIDEGITGGTVKADKPAAAAGDTVTLTVTPAEGYKLDSLTVTYGENQTAPNAGSDANTYTFTMPAEDVTITAQWQINQYSVTFNAGDGAFADGSKEITINVAYGEMPTAPENPTRAGYTFAGWDPALAPVGVEGATYTAKYTEGQVNYTVETYTMDTTGAYSAPVVETKAAETGSPVSVTPETKDGFTVDTDKSVLEDVVAANSSTVLKVYYIRNQYTFKTVVDGVETSETYYYEAAVTAPADPTKTGYTFDDWNPAVPETMPAEDVTITAQWQINQYPVTFNAGDGAFADDSKEITINVDYGTKPTVPEIPTRAGYAFADWTPALAPVGVEGATYTATYAAGQVNYTVETYIMDTTGAYGDPVVETKAAETGSAVSVTPETKDGFTVDEDVSVLEGTVAADGSTVLKVYYIRNQYTFKTVVDSVETSETYYYEEAVTAPAAPTKTGYTFDGWNPAVPETMPAEDVTVTAQWTANKYKITFVDEDGTTVLKSGEVEYDSMPVAPAVPTKEGTAEYSYTFADWTPAITAVTGETTYTATYTASKKSYKITFKNTGDTVIEPIIGEWGTAVTAPAAPTKTGYTFTGWDKAIPAAIPTEDVTISGTWTIKQYTITFDTAGGNTIAPITQDYGTAVTAPENPTKTDFDFAGWKTADGEDFVFTSDYTMPAENFKLTAQWTSQGDKAYTVNHHFQNIENDEYAAPEVQTASGPANAQTIAAAKTVTGFTAQSFEQKTIAADGSTVIDIYYTRNTHTLTFKLGNGSADIVTENVKFGTTLTAPTELEKTGYTFIGWNNTVAATMPDSDVIYTAQWKANTYTVTLVTNRGTIREGNVTEYTYGIGAALPTNVTRSGYSFGGWYDNAACTGTPVTEITATDIGNKMFYAKWTRINNPIIPIIPFDPVDPTYPPVVDDGNNGDVTVSPKNPEKGDTVIIKPDPDTGYEVDDVIVIDKNGNHVTVVDNGDGTYSFRQPNGKVNIEVTFTEINELDEIEKVCSLDWTSPMHGYTDLDMTAWYHDGVHFCLENGLMNGTSATTFAPDMTTSRAMIVTILWRLEGEPVVNYAMDFDDVAADTWYTEAIRWAASEGIVNGYSDEAFGPNDVITREQLATILYRYEQSGGGGFTDAWMIRMDYADLSDVSDWAYEAMCWMNMNSIVNGKPGKVLDPKGSATRAEAATMLYRYCEVMTKENDD